MNGKDFLFCMTHCIRKPFAFANRANAMKWKYVILQFLMILCLLYIPLFVSIIRTQPAQLYERLFSEEFDGLHTLSCHGELFSGDLSAVDKPVIYIFDDSVVYADDRITLAAPKELIFPAGDQTYTFQEVFGMVAVYNGYIPRLLIPILSSVFAVVCILQILFYIMSACALGLYRMSSSKFSFAARSKISIMASSAPAMIGFVFGFLIPGVHIILFQLLCLLVLFTVSKRYDAAEKQNIAES